MKTSSFLHLCYLSLVLFLIGHLKVHAQCGDPDDNTISGPTQVCSSTLPANGNNSISDYIFHTYDYNNGLFCGTNGHVWTFQNVRYVRTLPHQGNNNNPTTFDLYIVGNTLGLSVYDDKIQVAFEINDPGNNYRIPNNYAKAKISCHRSGNCGSVPVCSGATYTTKEIEITVDISPLTIVGPTSVSACVNQSVTFSYTGGNIGSTLGSSTWSVPSAWNITGGGNGSNFITCNTNGIVGNVSVGVTACGSAKTTFQSRTLTNNNSNPYPLINYINVLGPLGNCIVPVSVRTVQCNPSTTSSPGHTFFVSYQWEIVGSSNSASRFGGGATSVIFSTHAGNEVNVEFNGATWVDLRVRRNYTCGSTPWFQRRINTTPLPSQPRLILPLCYYSAEQFNNYSVFNAQANTLYFWTISNISPNGASFFSSAANPSSGGYRGIFSTNGAQLPLLYNLTVDAYPNGCISPEFKSSRILTGIEVKGITQVFHPLPSQPPPCIESPRIGNTNSSLSEANCKVYPNPATDNFVVEFDEAFIPETTYINTYNSKGQVIYTASFNRKNVIEILTSDWSPGLYTVLIQGDQLSFKKDLVIK